MSAFLACGKQLTVLVCVCRVIVIVFSGNAKKKNKFPLLALCRRITAWSLRHIASAYCTRHVLTKIVEFHVIFVFYECHYNPPYTLLFIVVNNYAIQFIVCI